MSEVTLDYGRTGYRLSLREEWQVEVLRKRPMPPLHDPEAAFRDALAHPVGSRPLAEAARGCRSACVVICDITRPVPNGLLLPPLIQTLVEAGLAPDQITVLVATGLHRPNRGEELQELVGDPWVLQTVGVVNHHAHRDEDHVELGVTRRGTPVALDRRLVEADLRIAVGLVEPHFMAGWSGGRKVVVPGVAHARTITRLHTASFLEDPGASLCRLADNPLHREQLEIVRALGPVLAVNTVLDEARRLCFVSFGAIEPSHDQAVAFARARVQIPVERRFPTVVTSAAGHPLDATYYQTVKGMVGALGAVEPGGALFVVSACTEGLGSEPYVRAQRRLVDQGPEAFVAGLLGKDHASVDEWQTEMQARAMRRARIHLVSGGLAPEDRALTGVRCVGSLEEALAREVERSGDPRVAVIPEGPYVVPCGLPQR